MNDLHLAPNLILDLRAPQRALRAVALLRVRNEDLILRDTLDELSKIVDGVVAFDDASEDSTLDILRSHSIVKAIVINTHWEKEISARLQAETNHRQTLLEVSKHHFNPVWFMCCDADERYFGAIREFFDLKIDGNPNNVRIQLFDAYLTQKDQHPLKKGEKLRNFRKYFGPEKRDIIMIFRNTPEVRFEGLDAREPIVVGDTITKFHCQHYGKAISITQHEATCDYYISYFPWDTYGQKWMSRKGKAVHHESDFNTKLYRWGPKLFRNAIQIHPAISQVQNTPRPARFLRARSLIRQTLRLIGTKR
jgi:glycosyltransferase involved in cell wall biosynthesis